MRRLWRDFDGPRYDYWLLAPCVFVGVLGGSVYVHGFKYISETTRPSFRELAIASATVAGDLGVMLGSATSLALQACIYKAHDLQGADVGVPFC